MLFIRTPPLSAPNSFERFGLLAPRSSGSDGTKERFTQQLPHSARELGTWQRTESAQLPPKK
eukprot:919496-Prorocentrum_lima.AAC.1